MLKCTFALCTIVHIWCALCLSSCIRCSMLSLFVETRGYWTKAIVNVIVLVRKIWRVTIQLDKCIWYTIHFMCKLLCVRHLNRHSFDVCRNRWLNGNAHMPSLFVIHLRCRSRSEGTENQIFRLAWLEHIQSVYHFYPWNCDLVLLSNSKKWKYTNILKI